MDGKLLMQKMMMFMRKARMEMGGHGMPGMGPGRGMPPFGPHGKRPPLSREHLLILIGKHPEGIRQKMIAEEAGINQSSTSELIDKLENDGYIERRVDPTDKRATLLFLTELGAARADEVEDERKEMFKGLFAKLSEEEKQTLSDLLDKLLEEETAQACGCYIRQVWHDKH